MGRSLKNVQEVVSWRLCLGCGACIAVCPEGALTLVDIEDDGLRPVVDPGKCAQCGTCMQVCPGIEVDGRLESNGVIGELRPEWGPVLEVWEGYAADPEVRFRGSSGGVATALSLFCLERGGLSGVLHIGPSEAHPLANVAVLSHSRAALLARTGSRYAPAAPCSGLRLLDAQSSPCVFVGKPCDVVAVRKWQALQKESRAKIGLAISIFCAGTPSTQGTRRILEKLAILPDQVAHLRYRGCGWPGRTVVATKSDGAGEHSLSYEESWGTILSKHTQFRCRLCPDSTGESADISCGDPWYRQIEPGDPGRSLVLVRTGVGRKILHGAMQAGYVHLQPAESNTLPRSQRSLLQRRRQLWGRLLALQVFGAPVPRYHGFPLFTNWRSLPVVDKLRSTLGMARRIWTRKWNKPLRREWMK